MAQYCDVALALFAEFHEPGWMRAQSIQEGRRFQFILVLLEVTLPPIIQECVSQTSSLGAHNRQPGAIRVQTHSNQVPDAGLCRDKRVN